MAQRLGWHTVSGFSCTVQSCLYIAWYPFGNYWNFRETIHRVAVAQFNKALADIAW